MNQPPNFNPLARPYCWIEWFSFGPWLSLTRRTFLAKATHARRALVLGDGDGRFTAHLLRTNPTIEVDAVDSSSAMLQELRRRAGPHVGRVRVHLADARTWQAPVPVLFHSCDQPYDLIATHFFLDCLTEPEVRRVAAGISRAAGMVRSLPVPWSVSFTGVLDCSPGLRCGRFPITPQPCAMRVSHRSSATPGWAGCLWRNAGPIELEAPHRARVVEAS